MLTPFQRRNSKLKSSSLELGIAMRSDIRRGLFATLLLMAGLVLAAPAAWAEDGLSGRYAMDGRAAGGAPYDGELAIQSRGHAFDVDWQRGGGAAERGFGLLLNHVLGVAYWPDNAPRGSGLGTVIYRIDGGTLDGIWLPEGVHDRAPGHEMLIGSSDLTGRFQITLGRNPWGGRYAGYAELERTGDHLTMTWYLTSSEVFVGNGIKIGNVLAVAYAFRRAPAIAAYCSNGRQLEGGWWTGSAGSSGEETLTPVAGSGAELSSLPQPNTGDPCHTPIAANW
jgi:hypothetical protein